MYSGLFETMNDGRAATLAIGRVREVVVGNEPPHEPFRRRRWAMQVIDRRFMRRYVIRQAADGRRSYRMHAEDGTLVCSFYPDSLPWTRGIYGGRRYSVACFGEKHLFARNIHRAKAECLGIRLTARRMFSSPTKRHLVSEVGLSGRYMALSRHYLALSFCVLACRDRLVRLPEAGYKEQLQRLPELGLRAGGIGRAAM
ncbi:MAG: hypothetical protein AAGK09_04270 [Planctomycetota bacterium]